MARHHPVLRPAQQLQEAPNDDIGTLQGVDNIEVERHRARLYEFWIETQLGPTNVRAGLYDLNSEFYANDSASLLIAPAFGIGSELAATGPNGPSIFPSTALAARFQWTLSESSRLQFAALNATAGVLGDPGGSIPRSTTAPCWLRSGVGLGPPT
ncbi:MAG: carbohydrate porin [Caulobacteraceae bacterium]|nr:carbohydrate porin [Caulobacteraceae bacterium]